MDPRQNIAAITKQLVAKEAKALGKKKFTLTLDGKELKDDLTFKKMRDDGFDESTPIIVKLPGAAHKK